MQKPLICLCMCKHACISPLFVCLHANHACRGPIPSRLMCTHACASFLLLWGCYWVFGLTLICSVLETDASSGLKTREAGETVRGRGLSVDVPTRETGSICSTEMEMGAVGPPARRLCRETETVQVSPPSLLPSSSKSHAVAATKEDARTRLLRERPRTVPSQLVHAA